MTILLYTDPLSLGRPLAQPIAGDANIELLVSMSSFFISPVGKIPQLLERQQERNSSSDKNNERSNIIVVVFLQLWRAAMIIYEYTGEYSSREVKIV